MRIQEFDTSEITILPEFRARKSEPDEKKVEAIAENMWERFEAGQVHQIQPAIVRVSDDGKTILEAGEHRLLAIVRLNKNLPKGAEKLKFHAVVVREDDTQALITAIQENEFRVATNIFDRASAMERLVALGKTQEEVAHIFNLKASTVSDTLLAGKLPKKYQTMVTGPKATLTTEAAIVLARVPVEGRDEVIAAVMEHRENLEAIAEHAEALKKEWEAAAVEEPEEGDKKAGKKKPPTPKPEVRKSKPKKISAGEVKTVARKKGVMKDATMGSRTMKDLINFLLAFFGPDVTEQIPQPARDLAEAIEVWRDRSRQDPWMRDKWLECCRSKY